MNRGLRTLLVVGIAVVSAGIASFAIYRAVLAIPERRVEVPTAFAVVAARPLPTGARLSSGDVKVVAWPARNPVSGGFSSVDPVINRGLLAPVGENEPLTESKLAPLESGAGLPPTITAGMRAISLKVNEVIGVAGFVIPGTRVDVVVTVNRQEDSMSRVVVSNVQVLTAGTRYDQAKSKDGQPIPTSVVTLMVTPDDAERIALASNEGRITLTLRNPLDTEPTESKGVRMANLMGQPAPPPVPKVVGGQTRMVVPRVVVEPPPPPRVYTVEAIRAAKRTEEVVK